ncbi:MFS transporter [Bradyrhizobium sp. CCBAU 53340]|nr:MFS transporter [Bradyrhizobium sp. CCBAU 53340]
MLAYVLAFIDRGNAGFAKLQFMGDLHFNEATFGLGGGLFYLGYSVFEIPSNLWLARIGARSTLLRIMVCWGLCSAALAFMTAPSHYYILRFMLGAAEAGLFPGVLFYLTTWIPPSRRSQFTALFMSAIAISGMVSGPLSGAILSATDGLLGLKGWQWLFLIEGLPSALTGIAIYFVLADSPQTAKWLSAREVEIITAELQSEANAGQLLRQHSFAGALRDRRLYILAGMSVGLIAGGAGIPLWLPTILRGAGLHDPLSIGLFSAIPYIVAVVVQQLIARSSDRTRERRWHAAVPALLCALGWALLPQAMSHPWMAIGLLTVMTSGYLGATGPFWTMPSLYLSGTAAAGGIALITTCGGIGAFFAPTLVGWMTTTTGSLTYGLYSYGAMMALAAMVMLLGTSPVKPAIAAEPASELRLAVKHHADL